MKACRADREVVFTFGVHRFWALILLLSGGSLRESGFKIEVRRIGLGMERVGLGLLAVG